ncbi:MAG: methyltransferase domain-containing protein [Flavobacteriaceae bacterium]
MTTIKEHCCGADLFFDEKTAGKQYRQYLKKGPGRVTTRMIQQMGKMSLEGKTLLDVGGGIGGLQWWFLKEGGKETTAVDASSGYLKQAEEHAAKQGWAEKTQFIFGDFAEIHEKLQQADIVTLDKVVCCYPNYQEILRAACRKSSATVSLTYPMDGILSRIVASVGAISARWKTKTFRPYIHPVASMRQVLEGEGFSRVAHSLAFPWHIETYRRKQGAF